MNYKDINNAILRGEDVPQSQIKNREFYDYLLGNNVAYYYADNLSLKKSPADEKIIQSGKLLNQKYRKTLQLIKRVCQKNNIKFLLFKTYKYIPEAVDNDIDVLIKKIDFYLFMKLLAKAGFDCIENEPLKGICIRKGFATIEPRTNSSFHGLIIMNENQLWRGSEMVNTEGAEVDKVNKEIEVAHLLLSLLYNPNYLRLYLLIVYNSCTHEKLYNLPLSDPLKEDLSLIIRSLINGKIENKKFPLVIGNIKFVIWWYSRILNSGMNLHAKIKHLIYFFYLKYSYILFNKLVFRHKWPEG